MLSLKKQKTNRLKFIIGGVVLFGAIIFLIVNAMSGNTQLYKTVDEFYSDQARLTGRDLRVAGWVGDSIEYTQIDANNSRLSLMSLMISIIRDSVCILWL